MEYLQIGNVKIKKTAALAPMAGVADYAFRTVAKEFGAAYVVGEMASCKGLVYSDRKTAELLTVTDFERPMAVQLFGCEPEFVAPAIKIAEKYNPDIIDINSGCPVPKVAGNGAGSALMKNPKLFGEMITTAVKSTDIPVTVKIRKGWDDGSINAVEIAKIAEECGASAVAVHGRTKAQMYSGNADWDIIAAVKQAVKIPVIGNGDVDTAEKCAEMYKYTGCDLVMVGRGACGKPWLFREIEQYLNGEEITDATFEERMAVMKHQIELLVKNKGEYIGM
ncbi:MAG: tRNA dihydrouridine synthase DusB, partial [Ruminiclostridium sp.]|nr:tRNA dihydrouridine synthase DusB [Ruminiclostridium sp.]